MDKTTETQVEKRLTENSWESRVKKVIVTGTNGHSILTHIRCLLLKEKTEGVYYE